MIDETDRTIIAALQENARTPNAEIARRLGMAASAVLERIRKLEERGLVRGYSARLDPHALGLGLLAFIFVRAEERLGTTATAVRIAAMPEVQEVHHIAGEDCFLVKVRVADTDALSRLLREGLGAIDTIRSTRTTIVLATTKESAHLPVGRGAEQARSKTDHG